MWFGWSGEISEAERRTPSIQRHKALTVATLDLTPDDYEDYYNGFANSTLWPLFHYRLDLATFDREHYQGYLKVNRRFAHALLPLLEKACGATTSRHGGSRSSNASTRRDDALAGRRSRRNPHPAPVPARFM